MEPIITSNTPDIETFSSLLGAWNSVLEILLIVMAIDYITGISCSFRKKSISSEIGHAGLIKKANILLIIILAAQLDRLSGSSNNIFRNGTAIFFIANDAISIIENIGELGIKVPSFLKSAFIRLKNERNHKEGSGFRKKTETGIQQEKRWSAPILCTNQ